jgi:hypothetical protein
VAEKAADSPEARSSGTNKQGQESDKQTPTLTCECYRCTLHPTMTPIDPKAQVNIVANCIGRDSAAHNVGMIM